MDFKYTPADFKSDQQIKWCPGCGDHAILNSVQRAMPEVAAAQGIARERFTVVSGIGCSSRFPYYMKTYGFHGIHGRAAAISTGIKVANPALSVWMATGDGDSLAIGGNHFIHVVRRNVDINIMLFNNEIYGLTKGQYSPTSKLGKVTKTSPMGTIEQPFNPGDLVLGARGTFFARSIDAEIELTKECLVAAAAHRGAAVTEVLQNCVIFNDRTFADFAADRQTRAERTIVLRHGKRMLFGSDNDRGLVMRGMGLEAVKIGEGGVREEDILVHDAKDPNPYLHMMLVGMRSPELPVALGVIRAVECPTYDERLTEQIAEARAQSGVHCVDDLLRHGETWENR